MNGIHDMGGMHGFGRVEREENEPVFHEKWEGRVLGISRACSALSASRQPTGCWTPPDDFTSGCVSRSASCRGPRTSAVSRQTIWA